MKFDFPKPTITVDEKFLISVEAAAIIDRVAVQKGVGREVVLTVFVQTAAEEYDEQFLSEKKKFIAQDTEIPEPEVGKAFVASSPKDIPATPKTKKCPQCGDSFAKPRNLSEKRWDKKIYCKSICIREAIKKSKQAYDDVEKFETAKPKFVNPTKESFRARSEHQQKLIDNQVAADKHIKDSVVSCDYAYCPTFKKFIKGMGLKYKGKEYCSNPCLEAVVNEAFATDDRTAPDRDLVLNPEALTVAS